LVNPQGVFLLEGEETGYLRKGFILRNLLVR
jgi:hypothetical protein